MQKSDASGIDKISVKALEHINVFQRHAKCQAFFRKGHAPANWQQKSWDVCNIFTLFMCWACTDDHITSFPWELKMLNNGGKKRS